jgi:hypothetical protein
VRDRWQRFEEESNERKEGERVQIRIVDDSVHIEGYVNAIERNSKPLWSRLGRFIERICKGAFFNALKRNDDVHVLLNHNWDRDLGSTKQGNLHLEEDAIGLRASFETSDPEVVKDARDGNLVGWSFGFFDTPDGVDEGTEQGLPLRMVRDMDLREVSILNKEFTPAYDGTLVSVRADEEGNVISIGETFTDEIHTEIEERVDASPEQSEEQTETIHETIDYSEIENLIKQMKEDI